MARLIEDPVVTPEHGPTGGERITHPAYAQIGASRVSGQTRLYDSDFVHNNYIIVRIHPSEMVRGLSNDWPFAKRTPYIEVAMSESQWATFVSAMNVGDGVPCTLTYKDGKPIPGLPPLDKTKQFAKEVSDKLRTSITTLRALVQRIEDAGIPKGKAADLTGAVNKVIQDLKLNLPFVADQFDEHMEKNVEKGKAEVHGYMTNVIRRAGLEAITNGTLPLQIEGPKEE